MKKVFLKLALITLEFFKRYLNVDISSGEIITAIDTHGGFHGDGTLYVEISFAQGQEGIISVAMLRCLIFINGLLSLN